VAQATNQIDPSGIARQSGAAKAYRNPGGDDGADGVDGGDLEVINGGAINPFNDDDVSSDEDYDDEYPFHVGDLDGNDAVVEVMRRCSEIFDDPIRRIVSQADDVDFFT
jgi:hypothetical protein